MLGKVLLMNGHCLMLEASHFEGIEWQMRDDDINCTSDINSRTSTWAYGMRPRPGQGRCLITCEYI
jgi:hypothetical protein